MKKKKYNHNENDFIKALGLDHVYFDKLCVDSMMQHVRGKSLSEIIVYFTDRLKKDLPDEDPAITAAVAGIMVSQLMVKAKEGFSGFLKTMLNDESSPLDKTLIKKLLAFDTSDDDIIAKTMDKILGKSFDKPSKTKTTSVDRSVPFNVEDLMKSVSNEKKKK